MVSPVRTMTNNKSENPEVTTRINSQSTDTPRGLGSGKQKFYVFLVMAPQKCVQCDKKLIQVKHRTKLGMLCENCEILYVDYKSYVSGMARGVLINPEEFLQITSAIEKHGYHKAAELERSRVLKRRGIEKRIANRKANNTIQDKDFVVHRNVFKCRHNNHHLIDIEAVLQIFTRQAKIVKHRIPAGYCPECDTFFIMESTYQTFAHLGKPICTIQNERAYLYGDIEFSNSDFRAQSLLNQYGYNVNQQEKLSESRRRKILATLIDNKLLTKSDIIGHLDWCMDMHYQHENAVAKWQSDRDFVAQYNIGDYTEYGINRIERKY